MLGMQFQDNGASREESQRNNLHSFGSQQATRVAKDDKQEHGLISALSDSIVFVRSVNGLRRLLMSYSRTRRTRVRNAA